MGANKIERPLVSDPRILARFQQTQRGEADAEARKLAEAKAGDVRHSAGEKLEISSSAHKVADMRSLVEAGRSRIEAEPEVRADRVAEAKRRLEAGVYTTAEARQRTAEQLSPVLQDLSRLLD
ncbi:MAG: flagellar biosynthesis anti-sigma factor FlgM [bacterium]|nr:flagellar biosynthesis anti-sigma factor FlgM [bacterium]